MEVGNKEIVIQLPEDQFVKILVAIGVGLAVIFEEVSQHEGWDTENMEEKEREEKLLLICVAVEYISTHGFSTYIDPEFNLKRSVITNEKEDKDFIESITSEHTLNCDQNILDNAKKLVNPIAKIINKIGIEVNNGSGTISDN